MDGIGVKLDFRASQSLSLEGLRNEISRQIQVGRKAAGLNITDKPTVGFYCSDPYICAAARLHKEYLIEECILDTLEVIEGDENTLVINHLDIPLNTTKWHSPVTVVDNELYYGLNGAYKHYWEALDAWKNSQEKN